VSARASLVLLSTRALAISTADAGASNFSGSQKSPIGSLAVLYRCQNVERFAYFETQLENRKSLNRLIASATANSHYRTDSFIRAKVSADSRTEVLRKFALLVLCGANSIARKTGGFVFSLITKA